MTCGACAPEAFQQGSGRVFGYVVAQDPSKLTFEAGKLYFMGAQHVYADTPGGHVFKRPGMSRLRRMMRNGDKLIIAHPSNLGTKRCRANTNLARIEADGVEVLVLRPEYFE